MDPGSKLALVLELGSKRVQEPERKLAQARNTYFDALQTDQRRLGLQTSH